MVRPLLLACLGLALTALVVPAAQAQAVVQGTLDLGQPLAAQRIAVAPASTEVAVPWRLTYPDAAQAAAAAAAGTLHMVWWLECEGGLLRLTVDDFPVPYEPGNASFSGTTLLQVQADPQAVGLVPYDCLVRAAAGSSTAVAAVDEFPVQLTVAFVGGLRYAVVDDHRTSGPQKQIRFGIDLENLGNSQTQVTFEILDKPRGKWLALLPEVVVLEPASSVIGAKQTALFTVATPFHNGYNSDSGSYVLRANAAAYADKTATLPPFEAELHATSKGWYIPGPSPLLVLASVIAGAFLARGRG